MSRSPHVPHGAPPAGYMGPARALILAGGGIRVAYQAGVIRALFESGLCFQHADASSGGILNLAMLLSGHSPGDMCARWESLRARDLFSPLPLTEYMKGAGAPALGDSDGILRGVFPHLGIDIASIRAAHSLTGTFNVCNYSHKWVETIPNDQVDLDLLVAGISLPIAMTPVERNGDVYVDAVWIRDANLMEAVRRGAEELWVVWCISNHPVYHDGPLDQFAHMLELSANGALFAELDRIRELNERIRAGERVLGHSRPIVVHLVKPESPLPLDPDYFLGNIDAATLIGLGYQDAHRYLSIARPEGLPLEPAITAMRRPRLGVTFREVMKGGLALGSTDPETGEQQAEQADATFTLHATIRIEDLDAFITDPRHLGRITGVVSHPDLGERLPVALGVFNLFCPTPDPQTKRMVYEVQFKAGDRWFYLAGRKEVRNDPGFDMLKDTTTLFSTLHEGRDTSGRVVGAGILRLTMGDFGKLLTTLRATEARTPVEATGAVLRFGQFFSGELWKTYGTVG